MGEAGMSDWRLFADRPALETALATEVATRLMQGIAQRGKGYLVVSGGSTPLQLFSLLSQTEIDWENVVVLLADERWVDAQHDDSNERMVRTALLTNRAAAAGFISLVGELDSADGNVSQISQALQDMPRFDVVILGMGEDAHTASLFPCSEEIAEGLKTDQGALITRPATAPHQRISLSRQRLQNTEYGVVHIVGDTKRSVAEQAARCGDELVYPISAFIGDDTGAAGFDLWWAP